MVACATFSNAAACQNVVIEGKGRRLRGVAVMNKHARECLERAAYCTQLAEAERDPELKAYLLNLAASWTQAAQRSVEGA